MIFLYLVAHKNCYPQFSWSGSKNEVESNTQEVTEPVLFVCLFVFFLHWACNEKMKKNSIIDEYFIALNSAAIT